MARNKTQLYIVVPKLESREVGDGLPATRLIRGTLREVESKLRGEWEVRPATPEETHAMADVEIESAQGEPG